MLWKRTEIEKNWALAEPQTIEQATAPVCRIMHTGQ